MGTLCNCVPYKNYVMRGGGIIGVLSLQPCLFPSGSGKSCSDGGGELINERRIVATLHRGGGGRWYKHKATRFDVLEVMPMRYLF